MIKIVTFEEKWPDANKELIEDALYKAACILMRRNKDPKRIFKKFTELSCSDINYIMDHWEDNND